VYESSILNKMKLKETKLLGFKLQKDIIIYITFIF